MQGIYRLFDIPYYQKGNFPLTNAFVTKYNGNWVATSTEEYIEKANQISRALLDMGIKKGDKIALITSSNRTEWHIMDIGILQLGAVTVPIYPTISAEDYEYILKHSESLYVFVSDQQIFDKLNKVKLNIPKLRGIYSFDEVTGCANWNVVLEAGKKIMNPALIEEHKGNVHPNDLASIIYTSGTTGRPKGVLLTHHNIVSKVIGSTERFDLRKGDFKSLSFLPCCHIFERTVLYIYQANGVSVHFAESLDTISHNLQEIKPDVMTVVPRVLEKVYDKIYTKGSELTGIKKKLFFWAIQLGEKYDINHKHGWWYDFQLKWARKLIFSKWRAALGGQLDYLVSGSAALSPRLARIFAAAEIPVLEGYGLTETSPVISVNCKKNGIKFGTVGTLLDNVEVKFADDGEIIVRGPNVMMGYYNQPEKTKEVLTEDGWFHTGDIGEMVDGKFLKITDRKKEIFKTSGGKYIIPQMMENKFKESRFIEQIMVIGEGKKHPAALVIPSYDFLREWANRKEIKVGDGNKALIEHPEVIARIGEEIDQYNELFGQFERIKKFELLAEEFSVEKGEITPTLKFKRKKILELHNDLVVKIYGES